MSSWIRRLTALIKLWDCLCVSVCIGTSHGLAARGDQIYRLNSYRDLYTNCTYVVGNLEIIFLDEANTVYDLSFLKTIRQVSDLILVVVVGVIYQMDDVMSFGWLTSFT